MSLQDFEIIKSVHEGPSTSVRLVKRKGTSERFVIKVIPKAEMVRKNKVVITHAARTMVFNQTNTSLINKIHFAFQSQTKVYLVKELMTQGDCASLIRSVGSLREKMARDYVLQILQGLEYLHAQDIIHRDLRPESILIMPGHRLCLTDYGLSYKGFLQRNINGTTAQSQSDGRSHELARILAYLPPDAVLGLQEDDHSIDLWAVGILTFEFLSGKNTVLARRYRGHAAENTVRQDRLGRNLDTTLCSGLDPKLVKSDSRLAIQHSKSRRSASSTIL
ncbi:kinase-like domain-containing protein [Mycena amicta]|nr:kinase-like domain-containing protein [Mycena amicta]